MKSLLNILFGIAVICAPLIAKLNEGVDAATATAATIALLGLVVLIAHIIRTEAYKEAIGNCVLLLLLIIGSAVPILQFVCIPALIIVVLGNIASTFDSIKSLKWHITASILLCTFIVITRDPWDLAFIGYMTTAVIFSARNKGKTFYATCLDVSLLALSVPLAILMISSILSGLRSLFSVSGSFGSSSVRVTQTVGAHMRSGIAIDSYTREVTKIVPTVVTQVAPGAGTIAIGGAAATGMALNVDEEKDSAA